MTKYIAFLYLIVAAFVAPALKAASVDTINIYSHAMHKSGKCVIILPESYNTGENRYPVVYLLHGYGGDYSDWVKKAAIVKKYVDEFQLIVVCPDGHYNSWYVDSPVDSAIKYESYISSEVPNYVDSAYHTIAERGSRAITGLSMGGHGALSIGWKHADIFGAAGSMSGVQNLLPWKNKYEMVKVLGDTLNNTNFLRYAVVNIVKEVPNRLSAIIFDCGVDDPFIETNRQLHKDLLLLKVNHDYTERNGSHNWPYWSNAIGYQLMFFHKYFIDKKDK
ncbi:MAG: alpha/beta hydrolase family protein [Ginsengibacter sp.]